MSYRTNLSNIRTEGGILPHEFLSRIQSNDSRISGIDPECYHLDKGDRISGIVNRDWRKLLDKWKKFEGELSKVPDNTSTTGITRERWLLPIFDVLGYGRLPKGQPIIVEGKSYAISHQWNNTPIHLLGTSISLDRRQPGIAGAAKLSPHGLVQEVLNRSENHLWGIVSNGLRFRILRDNHSLTKQAFVEFDLQTIMHGEHFNEFLLFWMICHQSRVESEKPEDCLLEEWYKSSIEEGVRALSRMREGVRDAIETFGGALLIHHSNNQLKDALKVGNLDKQDYYRQLLRLVYRLIFLFVSEERGVLLDANADEVSKNRYLEHYSIRHLISLADKKRGGGHGDLWQWLKFVMSKVYDGCQELAIPALGSQLWSESACKDILNCECSNELLLKAIRKLSNIHDRHTSHHINWRNIGSEELGSVYEGLLELYPDLNIDTGSFKLRTEVKNERKSSGSFYTPPELVDLIVHSTLDPVIDEACKKPDPVQSLLELKVCDPACGSGHFLLAAARRIAKRISTIRAGDDEPSPEEFQHALREVISRCIYGVDLNPMAVELCKVSLWMEGMEAGKPLSFLDSHVQCGNAIFGATPVGMKGGIPDSAFSLLQGDDKKLLNLIKDKHRKARSDSKVGQIQLDWINKLAELYEENERKIIDVSSEIENSSFEDIFSIRSKEKLWQNLNESKSFKETRFQADAWCAAFVWPKNNEKNAVAAITEDRWNQIATTPDETPSTTTEIVEALEREHNFFHWHLAFPHVFKSNSKNEVPIVSKLSGWSGGFDAVIGNPPWVKQQLLSKYKSFLSGYEAYTGKADTYAYFLELSIRIISQSGRIGMLTPNKWFRVDSAEKLRSLIKNFSHIRLIVDFGSSDTLFSGATTYPAAVFLEADNDTIDNDSNIDFVKAHESVREKHSIREIVQDQKIKVPIKYLYDKGWVLEKQEISELQQKLKNSFPKLIDKVDKRPIRGVMTGLNDAYYFDTPSFEAHIARYPSEKILFEKLHRGRDVERWNTNWCGMWQLFLDSSSTTKWPWSSMQNEEEAEEEFKNYFPGIYEHMKKRESKLRARTISGKFWWELAPRSSDYDEIIRNPKIIAKEIATYSRFSFEPDGHMVNNKIVSIPTSDLYILGVLNSRITWWLMHRNFSLLQSDGISMDIDGLCSLPIPDVNEMLRKEIINQVTTCLNTDPNTLRESENFLNELIYKVFGLNSEEITVLENSLPPRDPLSVVFR